MSPQKVVTKEPEVLTHTRGLLRNIQGLPENEYLPKFDVGSLIRDVEGLTRQGLTTEQRTIRAQKLAWGLELAADRLDNEVLALGSIGRNLRPPTDDPCSPAGGVSEVEAIGQALQDRKALSAKMHLMPVQIRAEFLILSPPGGSPVPDPAECLPKRAVDEAKRAGDMKEQILRDYEGDQKGASFKSFTAPEARDMGVAGDIARVSMAESMAYMASRPMGTKARPLSVQLKRAAIEQTPDTFLWLYIRHATEGLGWDNYAQFMTDILSSYPPGNKVQESKRDQVLNSKLRLPFPDVDAYRFLKAATEVFMSVQCGTWDPGNPNNQPVDLRIFPKLGDDELPYAQRRMGESYTVNQINQAWQTFLQPMGPGEPDALPYLALVRAKLGESLATWSRGFDFTQPLALSRGILQEKLTNPCLLELIWSYWMEEGMLVQSMNAISRRFQNVRTPGDRDPLATLEIDPLRPLNGFLWGYIQDEQHRLTVPRRAYEYDHHYGLSLVGRAVPELNGADSRTKFVEALHNLLHACTAFYLQEDDTTVIADGFPVLNALREVHIILSQGAHNQYGDLPWTARQEMLMQQWILARPEFITFLPTRIMVAYPEPWMDRVDAVKSLMGWTDTSVLHFRELAIFGERLLLGARFNDWTSVVEPERAANWARFWRPEVQGYIHAYRAVSGVDLTEKANNVMPSALLRRRLAAQRAPR